MAKANGKNGKKKGGKKNGAAVGKNEPGLTTQIEGIIRYEMDSKRYHRFIIDQDGDPDMVGNVYISKDCGLNLAKGYKMILIPLSKKARLPLAGHEEE